MNMTDGRQTPQDVAKI